MQGNLEAMRSALERVPPEGNLVWLGMMTDLDLAEERYEEAIERIQATEFQAIEDQISYVPRGYLQGLAYHLSGQTDRARP
ncbi:MAG: hypothetical protein GWN18_14650, partial [Thermoplasmata archaeon]|nr:hypothetical protein [Thermoplasmata archaeon]NIS21182.1 hypothetical protein [Thermoplasmata archaeon]NIT78676.1 hypothetical protein [Thermoplasmata archaeon]NIU50240.1 hypothetical protein [Thermoplasmata archaeon]NIV79934.1 hypothetical protein [Thermoplasmata archaeon]